MANIVFKKGTPVWIVCKNKYAVTLMEVILPHEEIFISNSGKHQSQMLGAKQAYLNIEQAQSAFSHEVSNIYKRRKSIKSWRDLI